MKRLIFLLVCLFALVFSCVHSYAETEISVISFGYYEQDNNPDNGPEPSEWIILNRIGNHALLLSLNCLDAQYFNNKYASAPWESCSLRNWLNDTFMNTAFTEEEQALIFETSCSNTLIDGYPGFKTDGGKATKDKIYLLSYKELLTFSDGITIPEATEYAAAKSDSASTWWLRSPGPDNHAALVIYSNGELNYYPADLNRMGVRPAMSIKLED